MSLKKVIRRAGQIGLVLVFLLLLLHALLPIAVAHFAKTFLSKYAEHGVILFELQRFTFTQIVFSFAVAPPEEARFGAQSSYASCTIDFSPLKLLSSKHIDSIAVHGAHFPVNFAEEKLELPLMSVLNQTGTAKKTPTGSDSTGFRLSDLPVTVGKFEVTGNMVVTAPAGYCASPEKVFVPVAFQVTSDRQNWEKLHYSLELQLSGNALHAEGAFYPADNLVDGTTKINADTRLFPYTARQKYLPKLECAADIAIAYRYRLPEKFPEKIDFKGNFNIEAQFGNVFTIACTPKIAIAGDRETVTAELSNWQCRVADWKMALDGKLVWQRDKKHLEGHFMPRIGEKFALPLDLTLLPEAEGWKLRLQTAEAPQGVQELAGVTLSQAPQGALELCWQNAQMAFQTAWQIPNLTANFSGNQLAAGTVEVKAGGTSDDFNAALHCRALQAKAPWYQLELPEFSATLTGKGLKTWSGEVNAVGGKARLPKCDLALDGIAAHFPFSQAGGKGTFALEEIRFHGHNIGQIGAEVLWPGGKALEVANGKFSLCRLEGQFAAQAGLGASGAECQASLNIPRQPLQDNLGLTELFPEQMDDKTFSGEAELQAAWEYRNGIPRGKAALAVHDLALDSEKLGLHVSGVKTKFELPHLPDLASKPDLPFSFQTAQCGPLSAGPGRIAYRMDAPNNWCIERLMIDWCQGTLRMESTSFSPESKAMIFTIHCERLDLMSFLMQTGIGTGTGNGEGKITGTLPIAYLRDKNTVAVRDGFLYTAPGEEGNIKLELSEAVLGAAPGIMMELSQDALRDFSYSWAKIGVNTKDDNLTVALQLNGKPNQPLYYSYQNGAFVKSKVPHIFQGIMLDVNFGVPGSELFYLYNQWNNLKK